MTDPRPRCGGAGAFGTNLRYALRDKVQWLQNGERAVYVC
jgi:hypothetical protein